MPRLVVFADKDDPHHERGDVIEARETGWFPGSKVLQNPRFRIIDIPDDEPLNPLLVFLERDIYQAGKPWPYRKWRVDLDRIERLAAELAMARFGRTVSGGDVIDATSAELLATRVLKARPADPRVIG